MLQDVPSMVDFLFCEMPAIDEASYVKAFSADWAAPSLLAIREGFKNCDWKADSLKAVVEKIGEQNSLKLGKLQAPLRVAVTGRSVGPPLFEPIELLGRDATIKRIDAVLAKKVY